MNFNQLQGLIETLKKRIDDHGEELAKSEWATRYALIDPLLQGMGWDTGDRNQVKPEYKVEVPGRSDRWGDYALFNDDQEGPAVVIEAKKLSEDLQRAAAQGLDYCSPTAIPHFAVTDGQRWHVYDTHKPVPLNEKRAVEFDLKSPTAAVDCLRARELQPRDKATEETNQPDDEPTSLPQPQNENRGQAPVQDTLPLSGERSRPPKNARPRGTKRVVDGHHLDADGFVLNPDGERDENYKKPYPPSTERIVDGYPVNGDGRVITPKGRRDGKFKNPLPPNTKRIVDGRFLNADGYVLTASGEPDQRIHKRRPNPYPPSAVRFEGKYYLDADGYVLTKQNTRHRRIFGYPAPYSKPTTHPWKVYPSTTDEPSPHPRR